MSTRRNIGPRPTRTRHIARVVTALGFAVAATTTLATACADGPTAPAAQPALAAAPTTAPTATPNAYVGYTTSVSVRPLMWKTNVTQASVGAVIGSAGGSLTLPGGPTLTVPRGAVSASTSFTITRLPGRIVAYDFGPHGTRFATPVSITHPATGTTLGALGSTSSVQGAYFPDAGGLDQTNGVARVSEFSPYTSVTWDRSSVTFKVNHFSGYLLSTGRM